MHIRGDARGETTFPRKRSCVIHFHRWAPRIYLMVVDVHQFSIITELLGTPPDDVIDTICSENVGL